MLKYFGKSQLTTRFKVNMEFFINHTLDNHKSVPIFLILWLALHLWFSFLLNCVSLQISYQCNQEKKTVFIKCFSKETIFSTTQESWIIQKNLQIKSLRNVYMDQWEGN